MPTSTVTEHHILIGKHSNKHRLAIDRWGETSLAEIMDMTLTTANQFFI